MKTVRFCYVLLVDSCFERPRADDPDGWSTHFRRMRFSCILQYLPRPALLKSCTYTDLPYPPRQIVKVVVVVAKIPRKGGRQPENPRRGDQANTEIKFL